MSRVCIIGDCHVGGRLDSPFYADSLEKFFENVLFPYCVENCITTCIQVGDLFDRQKSTDSNTLHRATKRIFDKFEKLGIRLIVLVGNHDAFFKASIAVNTPSLLLKNYFNIEVYDKPTTLEFEGVEVDLIPWICQDNETDIFSHMTNSKAKICFGHFQLLGFQMDPGVICKTGFDKKVLDKYDRVFTGHFHHRSDDGKIFYVGTPCQITWIDYGDVRGFHVFDTNSLDLEFIPNPYNMFHKVLYDDRVNEGINEILKLDYAMFSGTYVKVLVVAKTDAMLFDKMIERINKAGPASLSVIEEFVVEEGGSQDTLENVENTSVLLNAYVDEMKLDINSDPLKTLLHGLYVEAQASE